MKHLMLIAGEASGDLHGGHLIHALKELDPTLHFSGIGGKMMVEAGLTPLFPFEKLQVMGFTDVFMALPRLVYLFYQMRNCILEANPDAVILIDYPGFNLRMAKALRKKGYKGKIIHFIAPTVWAHGKKRIQHMVDTLDLLLTIFPFETHSFCRTSLRVEYVGNPLMEYIDNHHYVNDWKKELNNEKIIGIFPGSRKGEIQRNFPALLEAAKRLQNDQPDLVYAISQMDNTQNLLLEKLKTSGLKHWILVPQEYRYELMNESHLALAKSGTVTLELALHECPTVVVYNLTKLNRFIAKNILHLRLPHYCIVNILLGKRVFPEFIEKGFSADNIYNEAKSLLDEGERRHDCIAQCIRLKELLSSHRTSKKAAYHIAGLLQ